MKQEAFLRAGTRHFNRKGFSGTSLDDIAESLNVSKGAFYYHFSSKEALLAQCYEFTLDQFDRILASQTDKSSTPLEKLGEICTAIFGLQNSESGPLIRYNSITALPPDIRRSVLKRTEVTHAKIDQLMSQGVLEGTVETPNPLVSRHLLVGAINAAADIDRWRPLDDVTTAAHDFFNVFFFGLRPR
jgi:AcrR family transcriptional regulator